MHKPDPKQQLVNHNHIFLCAGIELATYSIAIASNAQPL